ncbi:hypothetical protein K461DRAFT_36635 [Myriangium duriaei CBS 260.36]|uniref:Uncharacterized protein n=1 Tax=Myriangium duriaei CBS 260.36 TaxID=1168546 RepID=A0A9P4IY99_9PEZI|nr:hypothetical protein K461DRAFT_36635 [Myriangium duriaei CBS 260.36]
MAASSDTTGLASESFTLDSDGAWSGLRWILGGGWMRSVRDAGIAWQHMAVESAWERRGGLISGTERRSARALPDAFFFLTLPVPKRSNDASGRGGCVGPATRASMTQPTGRNFFFLFRETISAREHRRTHRKDDGRRTHSDSERSQQGFTTLFGNLVS